MNVILPIILLVILIALSAFFSSSEIAYASVNRLRLQRLANEEGDKRAKAALYIADHYDKALSTILIGNNLVNLTSSTIATQLFIFLLADSGKVSENTAAALSTVCITVVVLIFGETAPKIVAKNNAEGFTLRVSAPLRVLMTVFSPVVTPVMKLLSLFSRNWESADEEGVTEDDLSEIIDTVEDEGVIDEDTSDLLQSALDFPDISAYEIITPRVDMVAIDVNANETKIRSIVDSSSFSRIPVYEDTIDHIIGVLHLNTFLKQMAEGGPLDIRRNLLPVCYLHKTTILPQALREMREKQIHLAIVTDEYGGTMGMITMEDILEQLVGDIWDESDEIENEIQQTGEDLFEVDGDMRIYDFLEEFEIDDRDFDDDNATVGGWAIEQLGGYPARGDSFDFENLTVTIKQLRNLRVTRLVVQVHPKPEEPDEDAIDWDTKEE